MRICLYTATAFPNMGGQESVVDSLARTFLSLGHEPIVLAPRLTWGTMVADAKLPYRVSRHPRFYSSRGLVGFYRHFLDLAQARFRFDVIHCHDVFPTGYLASLSRVRQRVPIVITSHGGDLRENNPRMERSGIPERSRAALQSADCLISIGPFTERGFRRIYPDAPCIVTIPNGVDVGQFHDAVSRPEGIDSRIRPGQYVLFIGRLVKRKGVDLLLDAMPKIAKADGLDLVIAGTGNLRSSLETKVRELGIPDRVHFAGRVEGPVKSYLLQNALCTLAPSRIWEACPLVLLESYAAGRPVIGSKVPGIEDMLQDGRTGILVNDEDAPGIADAVLSLHADPQRARAMGRAGYDYVQEYPWDRVARRHIELYQRVIEARLTKPIVVPRVS